MSHILVIDDDDQFLQMLVDVLEKNNFDVIGLSSSKNVENVLEQSNINLVITDLIMPDVDGIELIGELKKINEDLKIIAISGGYKTVSALSILQMAKALGANDIFQKPFPLSNLVESTRKLSMQ